MKESRQSAHDEEKIIDYSRDRDIASKNFDDVLLRIIPCKTASFVEMKKDSRSPLSHKSVPDYLPFKENNNSNIQKEKKISKIQSVDSRDDLKSKLSFTGQLSLAKTFHQMSQTSTHMVIWSLVTFMCEYNLIYLQLDIINILRMK